MARRFAAKRPSVDDYLQLCAPPAPPSGALINAILEHADIRRELGDGKVVLKVSLRRTKHRDVRRGLGKQASRLGQMSVIWDEEDGQIVSVCDGSEPADIPGWDEPSEFDRFELTEAALAYVASFEGEYRP